MSSKIKSTIKGYFLTGLLVSAPTAATLYVSYWFIEKFDNLIKALLPDAYVPDAWLPGIGVVLLAGLLVLIGFLAVTLLGRLFIGITERLVDHIPVVRTIYKATKKILETMLEDGGSSFQDVVLVQYPRLGLWSMGFVTSRARGEVQERTAHTVVNVFIPTTPNPTSGILIFAPKDDIIKLSMTVQEGLQMVISGGIITPPSRSASGTSMTPSLGVSPTKEDKGVDALEVKDGDGGKGRE